MKQNGRARFECTPLRIIAHNSLSMAAMMEKNRQGFKVAGAFWDSSERRELVSLPGVQHHLRHLKCPLKKLKPHRPVRPHHPRPSANPPSTCRQSTGLIAFAKPMGKR